MKWLPVDPRIEARILQVVAPWTGTPYMSGQQMPGMGVDCYRFVCAVLDELYGEPNDLRKINIPHDTCMHNPSKAKAGMRKILERYPHEILQGVGEVQSGDIVVTGQNGAPGHAMIALNMSFWHQSGIKVCSTSRQGMEWPPVKICRPKNKESWICHYL